MPENSAEALKAQLLGDGVIRSADATLTQFAGGVSSDVYRVDDGDRTFVVKQVLAQLRVRDEWLADTARIACEENYLSWVAQHIPGAVPQILSIGQGYFAMELVDSSFVNWKSQMLAGHFDTATAATAASILGRIHALSYCSPEVEALFPNHTFFHQLRIDAYLLTTAQRTPAVRNLIEAEAARIASTHECLVHGDYSPKNMLVATSAGGTAARVVLLDCETANYGDPSFDLAFLLNHLLLKGLYHVPSSEGAHACAQAAISAYFAALSTSSEHRSAAESRTAHLLPMLTLARVNGKSPAEYLKPEHQAFILEYTPSAISRRVPLVTQVDRWFAALKSL